MEKFAPFSAESWSYAGQMTLLGMGMVFAVLGILWAILTVFKLVFVGKSPKETKAVKAEKPAPKASAAPKAVAKQPVAQAPTQDDAVIAAIITAAVAAYMAEQGVPENGFRVVSFRRANNGRAWNNNN